MSERKARVYTRVPTSLSWEYSKRGIVRSADRPLRNSSGSGLTYRHDYVTGIRSPDDRSIMYVVIDRARDFFPPGTRSARPFGTRIDYLITGWSSHSWHLIRWTEVDSYTHSSIHTKASFISVFFTEPLIIFFNCALMIFAMSALISRVTQGLCSFN